MLDDVTKNSKNRIATSLVSAMQIFLKKMTRDQAKDTGMALALICVIVGYMKGNDDFILAAGILIVTNMIVPAVYTPVAKIWFGFSRLLSLIMPNVLFSILFYAIVTPIGLLRKLGGADRLQLKKWKLDQASVFAKRDHTYSAEDFERPF